MSPGRIIRFGLLLAVVALVAVGACLATRHCVLARQGELCAAACGGHEKVHALLGLSADQEKRLAPVEARFAEREQAASEAVRAANGELASAILADQADSPRVHAAVGKIHAALGALQQAALDHVFEMRPALTPEQYRKLLDLTAAGLKAQAELQP